IPGEDELADDHGDGEDAGDGIEIVEAELEIGGARDLHEKNVVDDSRQGEREERDQRQAAEEDHAAANIRAHRAIENIEADFLAVSYNEGGAEQHHPEPHHHADLMGPANGQVEEIAEDNLDDEDDEHGRQHGREQIFGARIKPGADPAQLRGHGYPPGQIWRMKAGPGPAFSADQSALMRSTTPSGQ